MKNLINFLSKTVSSPFNKDIANQDALADPQLNALKQRIQSAMGFIKRTQSYHHAREIKLRHLPWYLLIGSSGAGKTTMLANSKINYILRKQFDEENINNITPTDNYDFWITDASVIIDTPGHHLMMRDNKFASTHRIWQFFLKLVQHECGHRKLGGIIFAISVSELVDKKNRRNLIHNLRYHIRQLKQQFGNDLPFYFAITKCDLLPGFIDFFSDYSREELLQAWGITMPEYDAQALSNLFIKRFNALIKRLNSQVIWRLHQERNPYTKFYIKDFPLQIEQLKEAMLDIFKALENAGVTYSLKGVYLNSAMQPSQPPQSSNHPETVAMQELPKILEIMYNANAPSNSYFVKQFILQGIIQ